MWAKHWHVCNPGNGGDNKWEINICYNSSQQNGSQAAVNVFFLKSRDVMIRRDWRTGYRHSRRF